MREIHLRPSLLVCLECGRTNEETEFSLLCSYYCLDCFDKMCDRRGSCPPWVSVEEIDPSYQRMAIPGRK